MRKNRERKWFGDGNREWKEEQNNERDRKQAELVRELQFGLWVTLILAQMAVVNVLTVRAETQPVETAEYGFRTHQVEHQVTYRRIEGASQLPETLEVTVRDGVYSAVAVCEAVEMTVTGEQWVEDFSFPMTFHVYGADYYQIGDWLVELDEAGHGPESAEKRAESAGNVAEWRAGGAIDLPDECRAYLLDLIGVSPEEYVITGFFWDGEAYEDESGQLCRDALGAGKRLVRDYRVRYVGSVRLPEDEPKPERRVEEPEQQVVSEETGEERESTEAAEIQTEEPVVQVEPEQDSDEADLQEEITLWQKITRVMLAAIGIGACLFFGGLLLLGILRLVKWIRRWYSVYRNRKKE